MSQFSGAAVAAAPTQRPSSPVRAPGGLSEFFRYHGLWAPGVRLFRAVGFRTKAWIIAATFALPLAQLGWNYYGNQAAQIEFSAKERIGVVYARALMPVLQQAEKLRLLAVQGAPAEPLALARSAFDKAAQALAEAEKQHGDTLGTTKAYTAWKASAQAATGGDYAAHSTHVQALLTLLGQSTDGSNLTLDPDIDTYYLMDASMFRLPVMIDSAAQIRSLGYGAFSAKPAAAQLRRIIEQAALLGSHTDAIEAGFAKAGTANADIARDIHDADARTPLRALAAQLDQTLLRPEGAQGEAAAHVAAASAAIDAMFTLSDKTSARLDALIAKRVAAFEFSRDVTSAVLALGLLMALYLFMSFRKVLDGGLKEVAFHIDAMRDGNLTTQPRAWGADEAARLMHTLAQMQASLRRIVSQVRGASDHIVSASTQIASGAHDLSARTEHSAANLEETASAMEEIAATVQRGEDTVAQATRLAQANADAAERGSRIVGEVVQTMQTINASSDRIGDIIGTIDGIAFQTNILALNAAVEAARAGEQGRGFAVVASEVRTLAQRTTGAAREIKQLIEESNANVDNGNRLTAQAQETIEGAVSTVRRVSQVIAEISVGANEQLAGITQVNSAVLEMDAITQQNAALVEEIAASATQLQGQAVSVSEAVQVFRLDRGATPRQADAVALRRAVQREAAEAAAA